MIKFALALFISVNGVFAYPSLDDDAKSGIDSDLDGSVYFPEDFGPLPLVKAIASSVEWVHQQSNLPKPRECEPDTCYGELDCFSPCRGTFHYIGLPPQSPRYIKTSFTLHTREDLPGRSVFYDNTASTIGLIYRPTKLYILVHGFGDSSSGWPIRLNQYILSINDHAVLIVDWSGSFKQAKFESVVYAQAVANTELVGRQIALLVKNVLADLPFLMKSKSIHFIGHGLGAHIAKFFADYFFRLTGLHVGRVTGLDPVSQLFEEYNVTLDKSTAQFVDILHTSAPNPSAVRNDIGRILRGKLGVMKQIGHLDIYFNGGRRQPGCSFKDDMNLCSHNRAYEYLEAAFSPETECVFLSYGCIGGRDEFLAGKCRQVAAPMHNAISLDYNAKLVSANIQFVDVSADPPYCMDVTKD